MAMFKCKCGMSISNVNAATCGKHGPMEKVAEQRAGYVRISNVTVAPKGPGNHA